MPPSQPTPQGGVSSAPTTPALDPKSLILPSKEIHSLDSAQRVEAGKVLEAQQAPFITTMPQRRAAAELFHKESVNASVQPLQTFQGDVNALIQTEHISTVTIAAAETERRARTHTPLEAVPVSAGRFLSGAAYLLCGIALLISTGAAMYYVIKWQSGAVVSDTVETPLMRVDHVTDIPLVNSPTPKQVAEEIRKTINALSFASGHVERVRLTREVERQEEVLNAREFSNLALAGLPSLLHRTLREDMVLGATGRERSMFIVLSVESYEQAFAAMLEWEPRMVDDLSSYFPRPAYEQVTVAGTSTATSTRGNPEPTRALSSLSTTFFDEVIANHDARIARDERDNTLIFWTFLDRNTLFIGRDPVALHEIILRVAQAPVLKTQ